MADYFRPGNPPGPWWARRKPRKPRPRRMRSPGVPTPCTDPRLPACGCLAPPWEPCEHGALVLIAPDEATAQGLRGLAGGRVLVLVVPDLGAVHG